MDHQPARPWRQALALAVATVGGVGFAPFAPGTVGSAVAIPLSLLLKQYASPFSEFLVIAVIAAAGVWAATEAERMLDCEDPGPVVVDEVLGMLMTVAGLPLGWGGMVAAFLVFRLLDIVKPYPVARFERLPAGLGIMGDDAMAGLYGYVVMYGLLRAAPSWIG